MKDARMRQEPIFPKVSEVITANALFEQGVFKQTICHTDQPSLTQAVSNCERRAIGSHGGFGYKALKEGIEISEQGVFKQTICHTDQPSLTQAVSNCERRAIGSHGGFGYKALKEGIEISVLDAVILAHWKCAESKEKKKQRARY